MSAVTPLHAMFAAIAQFLRAREPWTALADAFGCAEPEPHGLTLPDEAARMPAGNAEADRWGMVDLDAPPLVTNAITQPVVAALQAAAPWLRWQRNATYASAANAEFLRRYAYCELLGPAGIAQHATFSAGVLYLAPHTFYPPHAHPAEEAYHVLAGHGTWQQGHAAAVAQPPGTRVLHPPMVPHAMHSDHTPLLALYQWRGDISAPARFIR